VFSSTVRLLVTITMLIVSQLSAIAQKVPDNFSLSLSSPTSLTLSTGANMSGQSEVRVFFARDGSRFIGTYNGGGVVLRPGETSGSFKAPDGTEFTAEVSGVPSRFLVDVHAREPIRSVPGASFNSRTWYILRISQVSCSILDGDATAWIEGNIPLTMTVSKGTQTCHLQPGRHMF